MGDLCRARRDKTNVATPGQVLRDSYVWLKERTLRAHIPGTDSELTGAMLVPETVHGCILARLRSN